MEDNALPQIPEPDLETTVACRPDNCQRLKGSDCIPTHRRSISWPVLRTTERILCRLAKLMSAITSGTSVAFTENHGWSPIEQLPVAITLEFPVEQASEG